MNAPDAHKLRLTSFSHGGGCGCKIAPGVLSEILKHAGSTLPAGLMPRQLLVGIETAPAWSMRTATCSGTAASAAKTRSGSFSARR